MRQLWKISLFLHPYNRQPAYIRRIMLAAFWIEAAAILWGASFGDAFQAGVTQAFELSDKALHVLAFFTIALTSLWLWRPVWRIFSALFVFAAAIEALQTLLPNHEASVADLIASTAGLLVSWIFLLVVSIWGRCRKRFEVGT